MTRPAGMSRLRSYPDAVLDRATALRPVARLRERVVTARAPESSGDAPDGLPPNNLSFMPVAVHSLEPPSPYGDDVFDLVYAISILTHLTDDLAQRWCDELARIVRPGGLLLVTTHGDWYRGQLSDGERRRHDAGRSVVRKPRIAGLDACVAHHPGRDVAERLLAGLEVVSFTPGGTVPGFFQDAWLARAPA